MSAFRRIVSVVSLGAMLAATAGCGVELGVAYSSDGYPPEAFIATAQPVYYEGRASYWYGNRWYYRDGNRWGYYRNEPRVLYQRRVRVPSRQHVVVAPQGRHVAPVRAYPAHQAVAPHGRQVAPARAHPVAPPKPRPAAHPAGRRPGDHR